MKRADPITREQFTQKAIDRFWAKVAIGRPDECWPWMAGKTRLGYGRIMAKRLGRRGVIYAPRMAYALVHGETSANLCVCHRCDNPACVNPSHLYLGTMRENMRDRDDRGRRTPARGMDVGTSKICTLDAYCIRRDPRSQSAIARDYGINQTTVSNIKVGKTWRHLGGLFQ